MLNESQAQESCCRSRQLARLFIDRQALLETTLCLLVASLPPRYLTDPPIGICPPRMIPELLLDFQTALEVGERFLVAGQSHLHESHLLQHARGATRISNPLEKLVSLLIGPAGLRKRFRQLMRPPHLTHDLRLSPGFDVRSLVLLGSLDPRGPGLVYVPLEFPERLRGQLQLCRLCLPFFFRPPTGSPQVRTDEPPVEPVGSEGEGMRPDPGAGREKYLGAFWLLRTPPGGGKAFPGFQGFLSGLLVLEPPLLGRRIR